MNIPRKFKVFASTINVIFDSTRLSNDGILGDCSYIDSKITVCDVYKGDAVSMCAMTDTFYHEKIHIILDAMGEHKLSKNEKFVEVFARLLRQSDESSEF